MWCQHQEWQHACPIVVRRNEMVLPAAIITCMRYLIQMMCFQKHCCVSSPKAFAMWIKACDLIRRHAALYRQDPERSALEAPLCWAGRVCKHRFVQAPAAYSGIDARRQGSTLPCIAERNWCWHTAMLMQGLNLPKAGSYAIAKNQGKNSEWQKGLRSKTPLNMAFIHPWDLHMFSSVKLKTLKFLVVAEKSSLQGIDTNTRGG